TVLSRSFTHSTAVLNQMNLLLDFDGRRLQGARPFAVFEAKDDAWTFCVSRSEFRTGSPPGKGHEFAWNALRAALGWGKTHCPHGAAIGFFSYDFARTLEPRAF